MMKGKKMVSNRSNEEEIQNTDQPVGIGLGVGLGISFGAAFGAVFGNVGVGVALGICFGANPRVEMICSIEITPCFYLVPELG